MQFKIHKGFTLVEVLVAFIIVSILTASFLYFSNNSTSRERARDQVRLKDVALIEQAINDYALDNNAYPGLANTLYVSDVLPGASAGPLVDPDSGWIEASLGNYLQKLPIDPTNSSDFVYSYMHTGSTYEIDCVLENLIDGADDGGNAPTVYEVGTNLSII